MTQLYMTGEIGHWEPVVLLGVGEVAERIGRTKGTVYVMKSKGKLPPPDLVVNGGATNLWLDSTIDEWNDNRRKQ